MPKVSSDNNNSNTKRIDIDNHNNKITILNEYISKSPIQNNNLIDDTLSIQSSINRFPKTSSRFPRLQECAHFHYEVNTVDIPKNFKVILINKDDNNESSSSSSSDIMHHISIKSSSLSTASYENNNDLTQLMFQVQVTSLDKRWNICRTYDNFCYLDKHLHDCIYDRKFSLLQDLTKLVMNNQMLSNKENIKNIKKLFASYLNRLCEIIFTNIINCGPILNWFEIDNKGNRLFAIDDSPINIPAVAAAVCIKRYVAQSFDELSLDVGNMISVIDMPPSDETMWWRGKKELEVGFFPNECVELIKSNEQLSGNVTDHLPKLSQSVRLKHGKLITLLRSFFNNRPARTNLQLRGIIKQRVFGCDLGEHLSNTGKDVPEILRICTSFIEKYGMVDGIYRHTGLQSNIQKLRNAFDEEKFNEIEQEAYINDVHSVSSLLKMYFRELPNPLLTYQLYQKFINSVNVENKIVEIHDVVQQLPPPHYRTLVFLMRHLHDLAKCSSQTSMNTKNLAIVWAPNLLKSKEMDTPGAMQYDMLYSITLQANIAEFLIANADTIFDDKFSSLNRNKDGTGQLNSIKTHRPISVCNTAATKLISLEEAQDKYKQVGPADMPKYHTVINVNPVNNKKKQEKEKKKRSKKSKDAPKVTSPNDLMSTSMLSTKSNASPTMSHSSLSTRSFMRSLRGGSVKLSSQQQQSQDYVLENTLHSLPIVTPQFKTTINNTASSITAPAIPVLSQSISAESNSTTNTTLIKPSQSLQSHIQLQQPIQQQAPSISEFSGSFMNSRLRSSSNLLKQSSAQQQQIKSSPIPPPRQSVQSQINESKNQDLFYFGTDIKKEIDSSITSHSIGSPVLSTFKDFNSDLRRGENTNLNRSNSARVFQTNLIRSQKNPNRNSTNEFKRLPPPPISNNKESSNKIELKSPTSQISSNNDTHSQQQQQQQQQHTSSKLLELPNELKLSSSSLSSTSSSSSSSSFSTNQSLKTKQNPLVIHEDDLNSYDNEIYLLHGKNLVEQLDRDNKELNTLQTNDQITNRESLGFDYNPLMSVDDLTQIRASTGFDIKINEYDNELAKINNEINKLLIEEPQNERQSTREQSLEDLSEPIVESIVEPVEPNLTKLSNSPLTQLQTNILPHNNDCTYCKISSNKTLDSNKENQQKNESSKKEPSHFMSDGCVYCKIKSDFSNVNKRDCPTSKSLLTKRPVSIGECLITSTQKNDSQAVNFIKTTSNDDLSKANIKQKENISRSKSIATDGESSKKSLDNFKIKKQVSIEKNPEKIEPLINKRKLSMNFDEFKRRKASTFNESTEDLTKNSSMSKSLQDTNEILSVRNKIKLMELKSVSNASISKEDNQTANVDIKEVPVTKPPIVQLVTSKPLKQVPILTQTIKLMAPEVAPRTTAASNTNDVKPTVVQVINPRTSLTSANNVIIIDSTNKQDATKLEQSSSEAKRQTVKELLSKFETTKTN